jgi:hypothetical protein
MFNGILLPWELTDQITFDSEGNQAVLDERLSTKRGEAGAQNLLNDLFGTTRISDYRDTYFKLSAIIAG